MPDWGADDLTRFLDVINSNQKAALRQFPEPYGLMQRVNDCFSAAGKGLVNPKPTMTGPLFLRAQYAYKTAAGMALAGQVVEAFVMQRSCLEYSGYALLMFKHPELEDVFLSRHFDADHMKSQKQKFQIREIKAAIDLFCPRLAEIFLQFYDRSIDFGAHPNPSGVISATQWERSDAEATILTVALSNDERLLKHAMKSTAQVGLAALLIFQYIFEALFKDLGVDREIESLCRENL